VSHYPYLSKFFTSARKERVEKVADNIKNFLKSKGINKDTVTIVGTGISGTMAATLVCSILDMPIGIVRKDERCHSHREIESTCMINRYIIVDDFIAMGNTVTGVKEKVQENYAYSELLAFFGFYTIDELKVEMSAQSIKNAYFKVTKFCPHIFYADEELNDHNIGEV